MGDNLSGLGPSSRSLAARELRLFAAQLILLAVFVFGLGFVAAPRATALTFEPVGHFGGVVSPPPPSQFPEEAQLGGVNGLAVNSTGVGGVKPGTLYAATREVTEGTLNIARYEPTASGMELVEVWEVSPVEGSYGRCGKAVGTVCPPQAEGPARSVDVAVDRLTGNVYVFSTERLVAGKTTTTIFKPDGSAVLGRFGVLAPSGVSTASTPDKLHNSPPPGGIAVDSAGTVYVYDLNTPDNFYHRLMTFKEQTPGDPTSYAYVNGGDIAAGFLGTGNLPSMPVIDNADNIYVAGETYIEEYSPGQPQAPICKFEFNTGGITAMTVDPATGEPFFYTYKDKMVHRLSACSEGVFTELPPAISVTPERSEVRALAFDSLRQLEPREPGVLYAAAPASTPNVGGKGEPGMGGLGYIFAPVQEVPPVVESEAVSGVGPTSAELEALINPKGSLTNFQFQYITDAAYHKDGETFGEGTANAPDEPLVLGAGQILLRAGTMVSGLVPETTYRYRVVVTSHCSISEPQKVCEDTGDARIFRTYPLEAGGPADDRVYELVSPPQKSGGQVLPADPITNTCGNIECKPGPGYSHFPMESSPNGEAIVYEGTPFAVEGGAVIENEYLSRRTSGGWTTMNLTPPLLQSKGGQGYKAFDATLGEGILEQTSPSFGLAPPEYTNLYHQPVADPLRLDPLVSQTPLNRGPGDGANSFRTRYAGASADFTHQIFEANDALTAPTAFAPGALDGGKEENNLYESVNGQLRLVNVLPGNASAMPGAAFGSGTLLQSGGSGATARTVFTHAISADGSRIFWTSKAGQLYVRESGETTVAILDSGKFLTASANGSKVLLDDGCLYDLAKEECVDLTAGKGGFQGIAGQSEDLSHIYFVVGPAKGTGDVTNGSTAVADVHATTGTFRLGQAVEGAGIPAGTTIVAVGSGTLTLSAPATASGGDVPLTAQGLLAGEEENSEGAKAQVGGFNLYAWDEGSTSFVATLLSTDNQSTGDWQASPAVRNAEASPGGRWLAFLSTATLTGVDNIGPCEIVGETGEYADGPCTEVFLYDSTTGELTCPSCNRSGAAPLGSSVLRRIQKAPGSFAQPRYLTDAGRLYFDSGDSLTYRDSNDGIEDVYQYEPEEVGTCDRQGGCVSLISSGRGPVDSNLLAIDATGDNVFFTTRDELVPVDGDDLIDLYDARVNGNPGGGSVGSPCQGEGCQPVPPFPVEATASSQSSLGEQNYKPPRCRKGQALHAGRCVKKPSHKGKRHKKKAKVKKRGGSK